MTEVTRAPGERDMAPSRRRQRWTTLSRLLGPLVAGAIGAALAFAIFGPEKLIGAGEYWNRIRGDNAASLIGFYALAQDDWRWPLLQTELLNYPTGANIYYTDAIPLMALLGKIVFKGTGILYPYFGL